MESRDMGRSFPNPIDAQEYYAKLKRDPRVIEGSISRYVDAHGRYTILWTESIPLKNRKIAS
jgi:hypothetical protein